MDFRLNPALMSLLMLQEVSDWLVEHGTGGQAPAFNPENGLVDRIDDEQEARTSAERWLT